jgi:hypothetical protein
MQAPLRGSLRCATGCLLSAKFLKLLGDRVHAFLKSVGGRSCGYSRRGGVRGSRGARVFIVGATCRHQLFSESSDFSSGLIELGNEHRVVALFAHNLATLSLEGVPSLVHLAGFLFDLPLPFVEVVLVGLQRRQRFSHVLGVLVLLTRPRVHAGAYDVAGIECRHDFARKKAKVIPMGGIASAVA